MADKNFVVFPKGYANSNTTNVSIPSLLTGLSPDATSTDFHTLPVAWNYAKAAQSQTFLFTSQDWTWEHFDHFFFSRDIDHIFIENQRPSASRNDLGVNDSLTLERLHPSKDRRRHQTLFRLNPIQQYSCAVLWWTGKPGARGILEDTLSHRRQHGRRANLRRDRRHQKNDVE